MSSRDFAPKQDPSGRPSRSSDISSLRPEQPVTRSGRVTKPPPPSGANERRHRILLVEPNPASAQAYQMSLAAWFDVAIEPNPLAALTILLSARVSYGLVLCNVVLPGLSGFEFVERVKRNSTTRSVPVVLFNGEEDSGHVIRAIQAGARQYLAKTSSLPEIATKVYCLIKRPR